MMQLNFSTKALRTGLILIIVGSVYLSVVSVAYGIDGVNRQIPFHGELVDVNDNPLSGTFNITFAIYDVPTGGSPIWSGAYTSDNGNPVNVEDGEFRVLLGSGTGNELGSELFIDDTHYLGITVENDDEMTPRERMGASPYAINSDMLDGLHASNFLQQDTEIVSGLSSDTSILTLTQQGDIGDFIRLYNGSDELLFSVLNSGRVSAQSFENLIDAENTFAGFLNVTSGDASFIGGGVVIGNGNGVSLGDDSGGLFMYQDSGRPNDLFFDLKGGAEYLNITSPGTIKLTPNNLDGSCADGCEPSLELSQTGTVSFSNTVQGDLGNRYIEFDFTDGVKVPQGLVRIGPGDATVELDVEGTIRSSELAGFGTVPLGVDDAGNIIIDGSSDERLKKDILTIENALDMVLGLRGVRYSWKDVERFGTQTEIGFIAQEVEDIIPEVVRDNGEYLTLNTKNIVAVVVEAVKELHTKVEEYFTRTERLEREVESLRREIEIMKNGSTDNTSVEQQSPCTTCDVIPEEVTETVPETGAAPEAVAESEIIPEPVSEIGEVAQP